MAEMPDYHDLIYWSVLTLMISFFAGMQWVVVRVLLPLHRLTEATRTIMTGELPNFDHPMGGIREVDQLRAALRHMTEQIRLAQQREALHRTALTETQEHERKRIAREIHDDTIQALILVSHTVERAKAAADDKPAALKQHLQTARQQVLGVVDSLRKLIANLRPTVLDELGLVTALEALCQPCPTVRYRVIGEGYALSHAQELVIFRAAQEALHNALHHAQAAQIEVTLTYTSAAVTLTVADDGVGFSVPTHLPELIARGHYGLVGIRERVLYLGGQLRLTSRVMAGTRLVIDIPTSG